MKLKVVAQSRVVTAPALTRTEVQELVAEFVNSGMRRSEFCSHFYSKGCVSGITASQVAYGYPERNSASTLLSTSNSHSSSKSQEKHP